MENIATSFVTNHIQCWGCPVFDRLFQIVSAAAAAVYDQLVLVSFILFLAIFAFFAFNIVWQNIRSGKGDDPFLKKSLQPVIINSLVALAFLGMGISLPRFVSQITFEPVAQITLAYTQGALKKTTDIVNEQVTYVPTEMNPNGFYRPQLRDTIILLMKTTITQFQSYIKLGFAVMDRAFTWRALTSVGMLLKHVLLFAVGLYLSFGFFKLFVKFCFYFADIIVAMTLFAFFFPLSVAMISFRGNAGMPKWMEGFGNKLGTGQIKTLVNAIVALSSAVMTYTVIMVIIGKYFSGPDASAADITQKILNGDSLFTGDLSTANLEQMTIIGAVVLLYVINFLYSRIPEVTKMVLATFNLKPENQLSEKLGNDMISLTKAAATTIGKIGKTIISGGNVPDDTKKEEKKK